MTLAVSAEERIGEVRVRWVRVRAHLLDECSCGETDALVVSCPDVDLWFPAAVVPLGASRAEIVDEFGEWGLWNVGAVRMAAALGMPWRELTMGVMLGLFTLAAALDDETMAVIAGMETGALLVLRRSNPAPADVVRCLRLLRGAMESTQ